jgi:hypothetical protein
MATTIKVDGTVADWTWQDDQLLDPAADVDIVALSDDLTEGYPLSAPKAQAVQVSTKKATA